ncbi:FGGY-family carbohydrate kinase [Massilia sp. TS11]|uniref:FGGY-family carbohydrate kinase n=1 Tax=Massilia sp. TS11 TaxID=2908003 RepID=UPI001EDA3A85|nr:L-fuculose kinase [Massilia sp. TS11]MCG2583921.1 L-fuculose kinase [Massilia sp. TS11]
MQDATIVLDIGKTNAKLSLIAHDGQTLASARRANSVLRDGPYPHLDTEGLWQWMLEVLRAFASQAHVRAIVPVTHGATAALIDEQGLVLPVLDYESALPEEAEPDYGAACDPFQCTYSPRLPAGLNLGRQLFWLARRFPQEFKRARHILMYPQYWAWRLCGVAASEVTSLGCHTDLWLPLEQQLAPLVHKQGWQSRFPTLHKAADTLGPLLPSVAAATGLPADCGVVCGIHDSNASLLRHLLAPERSLPAVLSTGTWVIVAAFDVPLARLDERRDMLANVDAFGNPVACMRFMGGREFAALAGPQPQTCSADDIARLIARGSYALPCFAEAGGPFAGQAGRQIGPAPANAAEAYALATLYVALMSDYCLDCLGVQAPLVIEGSFTTNPYFAPLLAALHPAQPVLVSDDTSGTTSGGLMLHLGAAGAARAEQAAAPWQDPMWPVYRARWRALLTS